MHSKKKSRVAPALFPSFNESTTVIVFSIQMNQIRTKDFYEFNKKP